MSTRAMWAVASGVTVIGAGLLLGAGLMARAHVMFLRRSAVAPGTVVDLVKVQGVDRKSAWAPSVQFTTPDGVTHKHTSSTSANPPLWARGDRVRVLYDPADPTIARLDAVLDLWFAPAVLAGIGSVFSFLGLAIFATLISKLRLHAWLTRHGTPVTALCTEVSVNKEVAVNGRHPWRVSAEWRDSATGTLHALHSDELWGQPSLQPGHQVTALIDPKDPRRHRLKL